MSRRVDDRAALAAGMWIRAALFKQEKAAAWCIEHKIAPVRQRASGESSNSPGGFLVPTEIENSIISLRDVNGILRRYASVLTMGSDERHWPRRVTGVTASFTPENTAIAESQLAFDDVALSAKKMAASIRLSGELYEDEAVELGAWFVEEMSTAFATKEDSCGFVGDGTSAYGGIRGLCTLLVDGNHNSGKAAAAAGHSSADKLDTVDLSNLMALLPSYAWAGARWYASGPVVGLCFGHLAALAGNDIGVAPDQLHYLGFPISIVPPMPGAGSQAGSIIVAFGDLRLAVTLGSRRGVTVRDSSDRYLEMDQVLVRGTERFDVVGANLGSNTAAGPIVGLTATT